MQHTKTTRVQRTLIKRTVIHRSDTFHMYHFLISSQDRVNITCGARIFAGDIIRMVQRGVVTDYEVTGIKHHERSKYFEGKIYHELTVRKL